MNANYNKLQQNVLETVPNSEKELQLLSGYCKDEEKVSITCTNNNNSKNPEQSRQKWTNEVQFLLSCIALSVGLGNVWRFPFVALQNGGGAFVVPYIVVILLIGRPIYYMEVIIGQFASRGCIKAFDMVPIMKGIAYGQVYSTALAITYYASVMALTIRYLISSFADVLPWTYCREEWNSSCIAAGSPQTNTSASVAGKQISSAELFFSKTVLREKDNIADGIGAPNLDLVLCLLAAWIIIGTILVKGIHSSGKAAYFLATFPFTIILVLLCRAVTLPGAMNGIMYFLKPQWEQLLSPQVWYAAVTQMFFSLAICFGSLIMYASYNNFRRNIYRDVIIITTMDSLVSIFAGCTIFGILGNLAYETNSADIAHVVKGGAGLAFISYPEAISRFKYLPQVFAVLFFTMLVVLGIGSNIGMSSCVITVIRDRFPQLPHWLLAVSVAVIGFLCGLMYTTPGGQFLLNLVDFYGCSFIALVLAIAEIVAVAWIYGLKRFCRDIEFMLNVKTSLYWRICWGIISPIVMFVVLIYTLITFKPIQYKDVDYPDVAYAIGWIIWTIGVGQLPFWAIFAVYKQPGRTLSEKIIKASQPKASWGPKEPSLFDQYILHNKSTKTRNFSILHKLYDQIFG